MKRTKVRAAGLLLVLSLLLTGCNGWKNYIHTDASLTSEAEKVLKEIREKSKRAMENLSSYKPLVFPGEQEMTYRAMCPNQVRHWVMRGAEMVDDATVRLYGNPMDLYAQLCGWAPGIHNKTFHITPETEDLF